MIPFDPTNWKRLLAHITGSVDQELLPRNEYLVMDNRILKNQIKGRLQLTNPERISLDAPRFSVISVAGPTGPTGPTFHVSPWERDALPPLRKRTPWLCGYAAGCTLTVQVLWYSKIEPKAAFVFFASSLMV